MSKRRGLGKGLQALIPVLQEETLEKEKIREISIQLIRPNPRQPRQVFDEEKLAELAGSIKEHGVVQPIMVRSLEDGQYELVAGERRLRACRHLGMETIPALVREYNEQDAVAISLIENIQRQDLNPLEEALAYQQLIEKSGLSQEEVSSRVSKSRSFVANTIRLLNLPKEVKEMVVGGILSAGHARAVLAVQDSQKQIAVAGKIAEQQLSVRQTEEMIKEITRKKGTKKKKVVKERFVLELEEKLKNFLEAKVKVRENRGGGGKVEIGYLDVADLRRILSIMLGNRA
ncbi:MAG: ParB/RepB/Spo0J family partition protein [Peptococcaceae bacterium]|nr:MAG: ParB/RepB/Spo0J family partition protein [Peptococcaceae bacterium]